MQLESMQRKLKLQKLLSGLKLMNGLGLLASCKVCLRQRSHPGKNHEGNFPMAIWKSVPERQLIHVSEGNFPMYLGKSFLIPPYLSSGSIPPLFRCTDTIRDWNSRPSDTNIVTSSVFPIRKRSRMQTAYSQCHKNMYGDDITPSRPEGRHRPRAQALATGLATVTGRQTQA